MFQWNEKVFNWEDLNWEGRGGKEEEKLRPGEFRKFNLEHKEQNTSIQLFFFRLFCIKTEV
jgi:hypothetical protein